MRDADRHAYGLIPLLNLLEHHGIDVDSFLARVEIPGFGITDPTYSISREREIAIVTEALTRVKGDAVGLELAQYTRLNNFSVYGLAIRACANLTEVAQLSLRYRNLAWGNSNIRQQRQGDAIVTHFESGTTRVDRVLAVRDMACAVLLMGEACGGTVPLLKVHFAFPQPDNLAPYRRVFRCPIQFDKAEYAVWIHEDTYKLPLPGADPRAKAFFEGQCAIMSRALNKPFSYTETTRDRLYRTTPIPRLEQLADTLGMNTRTLQRRLKSEDTLFSDLLRDVRQQRAEECLAEGELSLEQIADVLGFSDSVAFRHAFKQWTGLTPGRWKLERARGA